MKIKALGLMGLLALSACASTPPRVYTAEEQTAFVRYVAEADACIARGKVYDLNQSVADVEASRSATIRKIGSANYTQIMNALVQSGEPHRNATDAKCQSYAVDAANHANRQAQAAQQAQINAANRAASAAEYANQQSALQAQQQWYQNFGNNAMRQALSY